MQGIKPKMPIKNLEHKAKALLGKHIENNLRRKKDEEDVMECIDRVNANGMECIDRVNADVECIDRVNANRGFCMECSVRDTACIDMVNALQSKMVVYFWGFAASRLCRGNNGAFRRDVWNTHL